MKRMPKVFISATSSDLKRARRHVTELVLQSEAYPIVQEGFPAEPDNVFAKRSITLKLRAANAVIHLAGLCYGEDSASRSKRQARRSWTQMEYYEAKRLGKKILVCIADQRFYRGAIPAETGTKVERKEKARLQKMHYDSLCSAEGWHYTFKKVADLTRPVAVFLKSLNKDISGKRASPKLLYIGAQKGTGGYGFKDFDLKEQLKTLKKATLRKSGSSAISIYSLFDASPLEILAKINEVRPDILHISGAQEAGCIKLHDKNRHLIPFDAEKLADLIADSNNGSLRLVVLDTCYSMQQAKRLTKRGVPYAVGIYDAIADDVATEFYGCFYNAIAAGRDIKSALNNAKTLILGRSKADKCWLETLEKEILEMEFDERLHLPEVSAASGLDASSERFI